MTGSQPQCQGLHSGRLRRGSWGRARPWRMKGDGPSLTANTLRPSGLDVKTGCCRSGVRIRDPGPSATSQAASVRRGRSPGGRVPRAFGRTGRLLSAAGEGRPTARASVKVTTTTAFLNHPWCSMRSSRAPQAHRARAAEVKGADRVPLMPKPLRCPDRRYSGSPGRGP